MKHGYLKVGSKLKDTLTDKETLKIHPSFRGVDKISVSIDNDNYVSITLMRKGKVTSQRFIPHRLILDMFIDDELPKLHNKKEMSKTVLGARTKWSVSELPNERTAEF